MLLDAGDELDWEGVGGAGGVFEGDTLLFLGGGGGGANGEVMNSCFKVGEFRGDEPAFGEIVGGEGAILFEVELEEDRVAWSDDGSEGDGLAFSSDEGGSGAAVFSDLF